MRNLDSDLNGCSLEDEGTSAVNASIRRERVHGVPPYKVDMMILLNYSRGVDNSREAMDEHKKITLSQG